MTDNGRTLPRGILLGDAAEKAEAQRRQAWLAKALDSLRWLDELIKNLERSGKRELGETVERAKVVRSNLEYLYGRALKVEEPKITAELNGIEQGSSETFEPAFGEKA